MDHITKIIFLRDCNSRTVEELLSVIRAGYITLDELKDSSLDASKTNQIEGHLRSQQGQKDKSNEKESILNQISSRKLKADEIRLKVNSQIITFDDIEKNTSLSKSTVKSLRNYCNSNRMTTFKTVADLPAMEEGRTDIYFIGVPGSGKSTMLSGILHNAHKNGILLPDPYNQAGSLFQDQLIDDLNKGVLPQATASGSYNYVALSIMGNDQQRHPFNIVEVPGENYVQIYNQGDVDGFLSYIQNRNKKILIFVIDSLSHNSGYVESIDQIDQSLVYVNILQLFQQYGVLNHTDAVYLVANKFDAIKESRYENNGKSDAENAADFIQQEFLSLINNCKSIRDDSKNKFKIRILPYSIGSVAFESILESYDNSFSSNLLSHVIADSFVVKGGKWTKFFN